MNLLKYSGITLKLCTNTSRSLLNPLILQTGREEQERKEEGKEGSGL